MIGRETVLTFGELLLRISPDVEGNWLKQGQLPFYIGGAELNVATALALWGVPSRYLTALPENDVTKQIRNYVEQKNINLHIHLQPGRVGLFYLTQGGEMKDDHLVYDRSASSFSLLKGGQIQWELAFEGVQRFHFSAICPAISEGVAAVCEEALKIASEKGIIVSIDLNYRSKLWSYGKQPQEVMPDLIKYCDVVMGNIWAAETMLGFPVPHDIHEVPEKKSYLDAALVTSRRIMEKYPKCKAVANTFRFRQGKGITYFASLYTDNVYYHSATYNSDRVVDQVGSGDCFMAGLIYGFYNQLTPQYTLDFATVAAFKKLFINGDATTMTSSEVEKNIKDHN